MSVSVLFLIGRFLLVVPFVMIGVDRLLADETSVAERAWSAVGLLAAVGVVLGAWGDVAAFTLGVAAIGLAVVEAHPPEEVDAARFRLVGLLGAAVVTAACFIAVGTALDLTVTDPVLDLDLR
jgi:hypothetical protein